MSQSGGDFSLPDEILAVIPTDPYDQLDLARKITSMAIASRVSTLESQVSGLRQKLLEKDGLVLELEHKVSSFQRLYHESESTLKNLVDENMKLTQERDSLAITAKKLGRDFAKLEAFKRQLMQSLNDENPSQSETADLKMVPRDKDENSNGLSARGSYSNKEGFSEARQRLPLTPQFSPAFTPSGTPKMISTAASPRSYSAASSPKLFSGAASPTSSHYDVRLWSSASQQSSVPNSPPRSHSVSARHPRIDGKEFFRQARSRLSYEQFSAFLANIKELNARKQSREETLHKAEEIFGKENNDLYISFKGLVTGGR
ncbi:PREDICTED: uncharacterized protein At4g15545 [Camelina sativa]|uniref:Uncharacterized protein At4g15545 n=1 Tax=Camelina sativa TaxID=90675 RepID=A0ABM0X3S6_CAMSA|nr:PREDICTED: uncharacterized protein At4g15545 [Camelina sativa]